MAWGLDSLGFRFRIRGLGFGLGFRAIGFTTYFSNNQEENRLNFHARTKYGNPKSLKFN